MQAQKCLELRITDAKLSESDFLELAESMHCMGTSVEEHADTLAITYIAWFELSGDEAAQRAALAAAALLAGVAAEHIAIGLLGDDWETAWQKYWKPLSVGQSLWVRPSFCDGPDDDRIDIVLDPGMAFGTGTHPTTQLCLEAIERICQQSLPCTLLDMGAGSGLLAIAAGKLGVTDLLAIDNDPLSVEACETNSTINQIQMQCVLADTPPAQCFDLVVANILCGPLLAMATPLAKSVGKQLILSGLLTTQVDSIIQAYTACGLVHLRTDSMEEWASVEFVRPS